MKLQLRKSDLLAALYCVADKRDVRHCLRGVHLEFIPNSDGGILTFVSTNRHILFAGTAPAVFEDGDQTAPFWMTIPSEIIKPACKGKAVYATLESLPDGRYSLGEQIFASIEGEYPDFRRVIPNKVNGELAQYNPDYLARGYSALQTYFQSTALVPTLKHNGNSAGVITCNSRDAVVVIMPVRGEDVEYSGVDIPAMPIEKAA